MWKEWDDKLAKRADGQKVARKRWCSVPYRPNFLGIGVPWAPCPLPLAMPSSLLCSHSVPWLGEGLSMLLPHLPILRYPLPGGILLEVV